MGFILHHSQTSPFVRKVMVTAHETGLVDDIEIVPASGTPLEPGTMPLAQNPLGKIPVMERPDGPALMDSRVICRYLNAHAGSTLYPEARIWEVLTLEALAHGISEACVAMVYEGRLRPENMQMPEIVEAQWQKASRTIDAVNARWVSHLSGRLDAAQIALGCALAYIDYRLPERDWRSGHDGLANWFARFSERPSMQATTPPKA